MDSLKGLFGGGEEDAARGTDDRRRERMERRAERQARRALRDDPDEQRRANDFIQRYTTGDPSEGYDGREALEMYRRVREEATPEQMQRALRQTLENMTPNQRAQFAEMLQRRQAGTGMVQIERSGGDPGAGGLFDMLGGAGGGGLLGGLLGGIGGGMMGGQTRQPADDPLGGLLGGLFGGGQTQSQTRGRDRDADSGMGGLGDLMNNPLAKVLMGGLAAYAAKEVLSGRR